MTRVFLRLFLLLCILLPAACALLVTVVVSTVVCDPNTTISSNSISSYEFAVVGDVQLTFGGSTGPAVAVMMPVPPLSDEATDGGDGVVVLEE